MNLTSSPWQQADIIRHSQRLAYSFQHWTGKLLCPSPTQPDQVAHNLFYAPYILLSHGLEPDPILNYGNQKTLDLWEMTWDDLIHMPSRLTAEPGERQNRAQLLSQAAQQGYIPDYQGIRVSKMGRRFAIMGAEIWDVLDEQDHKCGQAAKFSQWQWL